MISVSGLRVRIPSLLVIQECPNSSLFWSLTAYLANVGDTERVAIAYCTKANRGARLIPDGTLQGVHFVQTPEYVQVTGVGDFTKINIKAGDAGGEIDNRGADGRGNPSTSSNTLMAIIDIF